MKRIFTSLIIAVTMLMAMGAKAQVKSYFGFFGGVSIPQSDFKSVDYDNNKSGFGKKGLTYGLDGAYYFTKNLGIGGSITYQDNGELNQNDADSLASGYTKSYGADAATVTAQNRYQTVNILLGPQYTFSYGKFLFDIRPNAGIIKVYSTPETNILLTGITDQTGLFYQKGASSTVFAYGGNLSLRFKLSENVFLTFRGVYLNSSGPVITNQDRTNEIGRYVTRQPINTINTTLGLSFGL
jgi:hypothetical protein